MNKKILDILEFDQIKAQLAQSLSTSQGQAEMANLSPISDKVRIQKWFDELSEFGTIVQENGPVPLSNTADLTEILRRIELDASLASQEFAKIKKVLRLANETRRFFEQAVNVSFPILGQTIDKFVDVSYLLGLLQVIDAAGALSDTASDKLFTLRQNIKKGDAEVKKILAEILSKSQASLTESIITIRQGRPVLPVRSDSKNKIPGIVHDMSASGQTFYIEPNRVVQLNNDIAQKKIEEKNEVARILRELAEAIKPHIDDIRQNTWLIGQIDLINAKYRYQIAQKATVPQISDHKAIKLYAARHPLIDPKIVVANDLLFDQTLETIVITGPNTGGKTITLKTLGVAQLMAQSGLPILADLGSQVGIFTEIFADIGDEQSIAQSLSTFSSHMTNIVKILDQVDAKSLVLFDELGAGTDPKEGAALAISILDFLKTKHAKTLATTHYPELKAYGVESVGVENASMAFDLDNFRPTYRLVQGVPGRSNALEISRRLGLPSQILEEAAGFLTEDEHDVNVMIASLEQKNQEMTESARQIKSLEKDNQLLHHDLTRALENFNRDREKELNKARQEAQDIVKVAVEEADHILKNLQEKSLLKPHEIIDAKHQLGELAPEIVDLSKNKVLKKAKAKRGLKPGVEVLVLSYNQRGNLVRLAKDGRWEVQMGLITTKLSEDEFEPIEPEETVKKVKTKAVKKTVTSNIKAQLDLRGVRYEEAQKMLDDYMDQALLANLHQITIVHGIGTGVIRDMVREYLQRSRHVKSYTYAPQNAGGSGASIVTLK
ncbi:MAG: endonuclease MutS2 [Lactococcus raffinolactis]|jgi:DNA mismatch repair protein MutS2|uniref:endonuclease MutS2 n=1 Tax=Pseudolactococcus raffinolactis TaxID=1366 RepID=UPI001108655E|nr:endonuclease MutS2 [Lactococcus raffinolactis]MCH4162296.1 endonuclease MutS2 [Lactococcus raffinolactis]MDN5495191.1 endonuclease MutS2 [Lactococcus raffinolactis]MDN5580293.1 endonuclease MutS2 [Lactococcus raffinolactis]MDN6036619.1 endonuclease MutS2 [Lactococcus raffinolactis]MDN6045037.1 endonuclease MutS2 [Lactococcus raffinolactis]